MRLALLLVLLVAGCVGGSQTPQSGYSGGSESVVEEMPVVNETVEETIVENETETVEEEQLSYTIQADDNGFYDEDGVRVRSLSIPRGSKVMMTFNTGEDVYYGGLEIRSPEFESPKIPKESTWTTPEFTVDSDFEIKSYWPSSNVLKARIDVTAS